MAMTGRVPWCSFSRDSCFFLFHSTKVFSGFGISLCHGVGGGEGKARALTLLTVLC